MVVGCVLLSSSSMIRLNECKGSINVDRYLRG